MEGLYETQRNLLADSFARHGSPDVVGALEKLRGVRWSQAKLALLALGGAKAVYEVLEARDLGALLRLVGPFVSAETAADAKAWAEAQASAVPEVYEAWWANAQFIVHLFLLSSDQ